MYFLLSNDNHSESQGIATEKHAWHLMPADTILCDTTRSSWGFLLTFWLDLIIRHPNHLVGGMLSLKKSCTDKREKSELSRILNGEFKALETKKFVSIAHGYQFWLLPLVSERAKDMKSCHCAEIGPYKEIFHLNQVLDEHVFNKILQLWNL